MQFFGSVLQVRCAIRHGVNIMRLHGDHQIIAARQLVLQVAKGFTKPPLDSISNHGISNLAGDRESQARISQVVGQRVNDEGAISGASSFPIDAIELSWTREASAARESPESSVGGGQLTVLDQVQPDTPA